MAEFLIEVSQGAVKCSIEVSVMSTRERSRRSVYRRLCSIERRVFPWLSISLMKLSKVQNPRHEKFQTEIKISFLLICVQLVFHNKFSYFNFDFNGFFGENLYIFKNFNKLVFLFIVWQYGYANITLWNRSLYFA